jgi:hypothetical protein
MKFLLLASLIFLSFYGFDSGEIPKNKNYVPDVLGKVNIKDADGNTSIITASETDSFPTFGGFPKNVSGNTYEGSIFCNMDGDSDLEIVISMGVTPSSQTAIHVINKDGSYVPGWPKTIGSNQTIQGAPAFGDIDGDGQGEIVVGTSFGASAGGIYAYEKDGSNVTGFPISAHGYATRSMVLGDIDNNGTMEIITNKRASASTSAVFVYKGDGTVYTGWPQTISGFPASSAAVGDITGDNFPEIIAESTTGLYAWDRNGAAIAGFPFSLPSGWTNSYSSPVLADVDGGSREIIFGTHSSTTGEGAVYIIKNNGTVMPNWPKITGNWVYGPPAVGFIDGDNILDICVGDQVLSGTPTDYVYAWNANGTALSGFPIGPLEAVNSQVILADLDNDNFVELIFDDNTTDGQGRGKYLGYNHDGTPLAGWPIYTQQSTFFTTPTLTDIDRNGILDMIGTGTQINATTNIYLWNTGISYVPSKIKIPNWQYNERHSGVYDAPALVGVQNQQAEIVKDFVLKQNYPNPFNPSTSISYSIPKPENVVIKVYDVRGNEAAELVNSRLNAGSYSVDFNGSSFSSGVYYYTIKAGSFTQTKKMVLIK